MEGGGRGTTASVLYVGARLVVDIRADKSRQNRACKVRYGRVWYMVWYGMVWYG